MARSILSAGVPITLVLLLLAFDEAFAARSPKIQRSPAPDNTPGANDTQPKGLLDSLEVNGEANDRAGRPLWNAGVNVGVGVGTGPIGQAVVGFGNALGAGVGGVLGSAANIITSPIELIRPFFGGGNPSPSIQVQLSSDSVLPFNPFSRPTTSNTGNVGWGSYDSNSGTLSYNQCNTQWREAILREAMNYDDWRCSARLVGGVGQACVLTGSVGTSLSLGVITTGCGWKMPLFCDDSINDMVYGLQAMTTTTVSTPPTGYTYVARVGTFKVHTETRTWAAAKAACEEEGAHLAVPSTADDYSTIQTMFTAALPDRNSGGWVGISDIAVENNFVTVAGQPACTLGQFLFSNLEPNNGGTAGPTENCIQFGRTLSLLNDADCTNRLPFICEITLPSRRARCRSATTG